MALIAMPHHYIANRRPIEATMIQATNVNIGHADMKMVNQVNEGRNVFDALRSKCSLSALLDANERYDPPRCTEATRRAIMRKMEDWACNDNLHGVPSSIFWLYGGAGAGKSALAQTLAEKFKMNDDLAASFFFFKLDKKRNDGDSLIPTLALQLVQSFQGLAPFVEQKLLRNPDLFQTSRRTQMLELLIGPFMKLSLEEVPDSVQSLKLHPRLVVIDGLDECLHSETQCDLLRIIADTVPHLPYPLRFLITSRPESHITRVFEHEFTDVARYNLSNDSDADEDIRTFLEAEFAEIRRTHPIRQYIPAQWPHRDAISSIVECSSSHFIYASTVIRFIRSPKHRPDDRLDDILNLKQRYERDRPYAPLDSLYSLIFREIQDPVQLETIHRALGIMHLRSLRRGLFCLSQWTSDCYAIEAPLELRPGDLRLLFDPLLSLVTFEKGDIRILHKSLFDYLLDSSRSEDLQLDLGLAHESAANHIVREQKQLDDWASVEFQYFVYHSRFARFNDTLSSRLKSLACDPKFTFTKTLPTCLLQWIFCFLQAISRKDFDCSGQCYRTYIDKETEFLRSPVSWNHQSNMLPAQTRRGVIRKSSFLRSNLIELLDHYNVVNLKGPQLTVPNGFKGILVPGANMSVIETIAREHGMLSSYVKARFIFPNITVSFLEARAGLIHSCHFAFHAVSPMSVNYVMLVAYAEYGVRLACCKYESLKWGSGHNFWVNIGHLVEHHLQTAKKAVEDTHITTMPYSEWQHP